MLSCPPRLVEKRNVSPDSVRLEPSRITKPAKKSKRTFSRFPSLVSHPSCTSSSSRARRRSRPSLPNPTASSPRNLAFSAAGHRVPLLRFLCFSPRHATPKSSRSLPAQIYAAMAAEQPAGEPPPPPPAQAEGAGSQRSVPTPFLTKTYQLVDDPAVDDIISWNDDGSAFVVWRPAEFARDLLPKYFKHNNFSSFVRQLNTYGFRKIVPDRWEFANDCFRRGEKRLLCGIHRRKVTPAAAATGSVTVAAAIPMALPVGSPVYSGEEQVLSSSSSPEPPTLQPHAPSASGSGGGAASGDVGEENERLRRENARLARELGQMKKLCNNILLLMSKYAATQQLDAAKAAAAAAGNCSGESVEAAPHPSVLELLPSCPGAPAAVEAEADEEEKMSARLFGVSIGRKRMRGDGDSDSSEEPLRHAAEVKPEPMDAQQPEQHNHQHHEGHATEPRAWPIYRPRPVRAGNGSDRSGSDHDGSNSR